MATKGGAGQWIINKSDLNEDTPSFRFIWEGGRSSTEAVYKGAWTPETACAKGPNSVIKFRPNLNSRVRPVQVQ